MKVQRHKSMKTTIAETALKMALKKITESTETESAEEITTTATKKSREPRKTMKYMNKISINARL